MRELKLPATIDSINRVTDFVDRELEKIGWHVSFGMAAHEMAQGTPDMDELVKQAESNMFAAKREFYRQSAHDRRVR